MDTRRLLPLLPRIKNNPSPPPRRKGRLCQSQIMRTGDEMGRVTYMIL
jgi:hypothetical protein